MRLHIIRHADPDYPNNTITAAGHLEAAALGRRMAKVGLSRIYSSPLGRALDTMRYTEKTTGLKGTIEEWTTELGDCRLVMAPWGEFCVWDTPGELIRQREPLPTREDWHRMDVFSKPMFRQAFEKVQRESDEFMARHGYIREGTRYRVVRPNREKIAVFCHGGFGLWWLAHLLELPLPLVWSGFWLPPSSVTTILFDERSEQWAVPRCIGCGDISHLYAESLPIQPHGLKANVD